MNRFVVLLAISTSALALLTGCGGGDRTDVSGTVTFEGKPVEFGTVTITPDATKKNEGTQGYAPIKGGKFDTSSAEGKPAPTGAVIIRVDAFDGKGDGDRPMGKALFAYEKKTELTRGGTLNLDIKASEVLKEGSGVGEHVGP